MRHFIGYRSAIALVSEKLDDRLHESRDLKEGTILAHYKRKSTYPEGSFSALVSKDPFLVDPSVSPPEIEA